MSANIDTELHGMVKGIVDDLEAAVAGSLYKVDGEHKVIDDVDGWKKERFEEMCDVFRQNHDPKDMDASAYDTYEDWMHDEIGLDGPDDVEEPDEVSLSEYLEEASLGDIRFEVDSDLDMQGGKTLFAYGGPNIWVADDEVRGYWGSSKVEMSLDSETGGELYSWFEEMWQNAKERNR
jgi:hypothetical protein